MSDTWLFWFDELRGTHIEIVGKKCANLGEMTHAGMAVPPGFALSLAAYQRFMSETGAGEEIREYVGRYGPEGPRTYAEYSEASVVIRRIVESKPMPSEMAQPIVDQYRRLCALFGGKEVAVAVRSSGTVSSPGAYETYLNIRGAEDVVRNVIKVWSSAFSVQALGARMVKGQSVEIPGLGVAVLKMVNARSAGVAFTKHPTTGDPNKIVIEAMWGLGESVVAGDCNPDRYVINKQTREVDKAINSKTKQVIYCETGTEQVDVPEELQDQACVTDEELIALADLCDRVEEYYAGVPQDLEWAIDRDGDGPNRLFLVQTRNITKTAEQKSKAQVLADMLVKRAYGGRPPVAQRNGPEQRKNA
ncbi:MAG: PEP/pyruvate-binding domain-containing protein [Thermoleophilia bacterium]